MSDKITGHTSADEEKISIHRYDKVQSEYINTNSFSALQKMNMEYQTPTKILIEDILELGQVSDDTITQKLRSYYSDSTLIRLVDDVEAQYTNLTELETTLTEAFKRLKAELPSLKIPTFYSQISAFNESIVVTDTLLGISLDKYMGADYPLYERFYHKYQRRTMESNRIAADCILSFLLSQYPIVYNDKTTLLDVMLHMGKLYYLTMEALEYNNISEVLSYTPDEEEWCEENQEKIWDTLVSKKQLNSSNINIICNLMEPAQYSKILGEKAPQLLGIWIGTNIIECYMINNKDTHMNALLSNSNSQRILKQSGYIEKIDGLN